MSVLCNANVISGGVDTGDIPASLRFRRSATAHISKTLGASGNRRTFTLNVWVKKADVSTYNTVFSSGANNFCLMFDNNNKLNVYNWNGASFDYVLTTSSVYRDPSSKLMITFAVDTTQSTASDRVKIYINGQRVTAFDTASYPSLTFEGSWNFSGHTQYIGRDPTNSRNLDGYLSRICFVDGQALTPSSFGYLNTTINEWVSKSASAVKAVVDAGGTNSFMLDFNDATSLTTLGNDYSSKNNDWTLNNFSLTAGPNYDVSGDVPGNSLATWNPLDVRASGVTFSAGNRNMAYGSAALRTACSTIAVTEGKWYAEADASQLGIGTALIFGCSTLASLTNSTNLGDWSGSIGIGRGTAGAIFAVQGSYPSAPHTIAANDRNIIAVDCDNGKAWLGYYDASVPSTTWYSSTGAATGDPVAGTNPTMTFTAGTPMVIAQGIYNTSTAYAAYFGDDNLAGTRPTGFKALCQRNLPDGEAITTSGSFTGSLNADGPYVDLKGVPLAMTINGNAVTFGTHADKTAFGFKVRSASSSYNNTGTNTFSVSSTGPKRKYSLAQGNP